MLRYTLSFEPFFALEPFYILKKAGRLCSISVPGSIFHSPPSATCLQSVSYMGCINGLLAVCVLIEPGRYKCSAQMVQMVFSSLFFFHLFSLFFTSGEERLSSGCDSVAIDGSLSDWVQIISLMELSIRGGYHSYQAVIFFGYYLFCYFIFLLPLSFLYLKIADCALGGPLCAMLGLAGFPFIKKYCTDYCILFLLTLERASIQLHLAGSVS
jgi:hypothetical protein